MRNINNIATVVAYSFNQGQPLGCIEFEGKEYAFRMVSRFEGVSIKDAFRATGAEHLENKTDYSWFNLDKEGKYLVV